MVYFFHNKKMGRFGREVNLIWLEKEWNSIFDKAHILPLLLHLPSSDVNIAYFHWSQAQSATYPIVCFFLIQSHLMFQKFLFLDNDPMNDNSFPLTLWYKYKLYGEKNIKNGHEKEMKIFYMGKQGKI